MAFSPEKNLGMGAGNNLGIKNTKSDFAFILNPDVILNPDTIDVIIKYCSHISKAQKKGTKLFWFLAVQLGLVASI